MGVEYPFPGSLTSTFLLQGYVRIAYGNVTPEDAPDVALRLMAAMSEMVKVGMRLSFDAQLADPEASGKESAWGALVVNPYPLSISLSLYICIYMCIYIYIDR